MGVLDGHRCVHESRGRVGKSQEVGLSAGVDLGDVGRGGPVQDVLHHPHEMNQ